MGGFDGFIISEAVVEVEVEGVGIRDVGADGERRLSAEERIEGEVSRPPSRFLED